MTVFDTPGPRDADASKNSKICDCADMIFLIMVLGRHSVMYWAPENESFKLAQWKSLKSILKFSPFYHKFFVFLDFLRKKMYK